LSLSQRARVRTVKLATFACLASASVLFLPRFAQSQAYPDIPANAHYGPTGRAWACNDGFKQVAGFCVKESVDVPSQGPYEVFDGQWRCRSGYKRQSGFCVTPTAPPHAIVVEAGGRWECEWGFRKVASRCEEIAPPEHAYLDASGHDWVCYPRFQRSSDQCIPAAAGVSPEEPGQRSAGAEAATPPPDPQKASPQ
jgi:hypothetical protein